MNCKISFKTLIEYAIKTLEESRYLKVENHFKNCSLCKTRINQINTVLNDLSKLASIVDKATCPPTEAKFLYSINKLPLEKKNAHESHLKKCLFCSLEHLLTLSPIDIQSKEQLLQKLLKQKTLQQYNVELKIVEKQIGKQGKKERIIIAPKLKSFLITETDREKILSITSNIFSREKKSFVASSLKNKIGIDMGMSNTRICTAEQGLVLNEPSIVLLQPKTCKIAEDGQAIGQRAIDLIRNSENAIAIHPYKKSGAVNKEFSQLMFSYFMKKITQYVDIEKSAIVLPHPSGIVASEKKALISIIEDYGIRNVYLIPGIIAAAIGANEKIDEPTAKLIVDIGGGTTEITVLALGGIVCSRTIRIAGDELDLAIIQYMKKNYNLLLKEQIAEMIKIQIGSAYPTDDEMTMEVIGREPVNSKLEKVTITSTEIREAIKESVLDIVKAIIDTVSMTPPELSGDIVDEGITLLGGGASLRGLTNFVQKELDIPVKSIMKNPSTAKIEGIKSILEHLEEYKETLECQDDLE